jgi:hypothetical protein
VVAAVAAFTGTARADENQCACPARVVIPERGATNVPINAQIWVLGEDRRGRHPLVSERFERELAPNATFRDDTIGVEFTTSGERDDTPPAAPRDVRVSITTNEFSPYPKVASLGVSGHYDPDTAMIEIAIREGDRVPVYVPTTPDRLFLCNLGFRLAMKKVTVSIRAWDHAGNQSSPFETTAEVTYVRERQAPCGDDSALFVPRHRGHAYEMLLYLFFYVPFLIGWGVFLIARGAMAKRSPAEDVSRLVAEGVARRVLRWYVTWAAMLVVGIIGLLAVGSAAVPAGLGPFAIAALIRLQHARSVQRMLDHPAAVTTRRGRWLFVQTPDEVQALRAGDQDFVQAKRAGIPSAALQRND